MEMPRHAKLPDSSYGILLRPDTFPEQGSNTLELSNSRLEGTSKSRRSCYYGTEKETTTFTSALEFVDRVSRSK
jgi:hypothetical protein